MRACDVVFLAFTELQTEIPDFSSDVGQASVPFFDYRSFTFKLLFPGQKQDHPILQMPTTNVSLFWLYCDLVIGYRNHFVFL